MKSIQIISDEGKGCIIVCPPDLENKIGKILFESKVEYILERNFNEKGLIGFEIDKNILESELTKILGAAGA